MATLTSSKVSAGASTKGLRVGLVAVTATYSVAANMSKGDVIQMIKVPANATPVYVAISSTEAVTGHLISVGDGVSPARYITSLASSAGSLLTPINTSYVPYTYSTDDTIDILLDSMSLTISAGGWTVFALFSMDVA